MRRAKKESGASLDSLLDTMTNVVGILVILLTVTQLGVGEAVKRISETDSVRPEVYEQTLAELQTAMRQRVDLEKRLAVYKPAEGEIADLDLRLLQREIADLEASIAVLLEGKKDRDLAELEMRKRAQEARKRIEEQTREAEEARAKVSAAEEEIASLKARLADMPAGRMAGPTVITLPDPRPAPEGALPQPVLCRDGRVYYVDTQNLQQNALKKVQDIGRRRNLVFNPDLGVDKDILLGEFNRPRLISDENFEVKMVAAGRVPKLVFQRRENAGETAEQIRNGRSDFERRVARLDRNRFYLKFLVWPDSFDAYLEARKVCFERDLLAGWTPETSEAEFSENLAADVVRFGPKPKPKPKPEPAKPEPAPAKPEPPKRPSIPVTEID